MKRRTEEQSGGVNVCHTPGDVVVGFHYDSNLGFSKTIENSASFADIQYSLRKLPTVHVDWNFTRDQNDLSRRIPKGRFKFLNSFSFRKKIYSPTSTSSIEDEDEELEFHCDKNFSKSEEPFGVIKVTR